MWLRRLWYIPRLYVSSPVFCRSSNCSNPPNLRGRDIFKLPLEAFTCDVIEKCPTNCHCLSRPWNRTLLVNCSGTDVESIPDEMPTLSDMYHSIHVDLSNNRKLLRLEYRCYFANVAKLDVTNSGLQTIDMELWESVVGMKTVSLSGNYLTTLPEDVVRVDLSKSDVQLSLGVNPWACRCEMTWMIGWLNSIADHVTDIDSVLCGDRYNPQLFGMRLRNLTSTDLCRSSDSVTDWTLVLYLSLSVCSLPVSSPWWSSVVCESSFTDDGSSTLSTAMIVPAKTWISTCSCAAAATTTSSSRYLYSKFSRGATTACVIICRTSFPVKS